MSNLITSFNHNNFFADFVAENVVDDSVGVEMCELYRESLKSMSFGHIVLDTGLKLIIGEGLAAYPFKLVVAQGCLKEI